MAEIFSVLPLISFTTDKGVATPSLASHVEVLLRDLLTAFIPSPEAVKDLAFASLAKLSYFVVAMIALFASRLLTGSAISWGRTDKSSVLWIFAAVLAACSIDIAIDLYEYASGGMGIHDVFRPGCGSYVIATDETTSFLVFLFALFLPIVIGPLCEEILYRGILGNSLPPVLGALGTAVLSSTLFALSHISHVNHLSDFVPYFLMGVVFFAARIRFGGIGVALAAHMAVNSFFTFGALLRC